MKKMKNMMKYMLATTAMIGFVTSAQAETVETTTVTSQIIEDDTRTFEISQFDINQDGHYAMSEIGEKLFFIYDTDGNEIIDNIEYGNKSVVTIVPMKTEKYTVIDRNDDGVAEKRAYSYTEFMDQTGLATYDKNYDGLSPHEFMDKGFLKADLNNDKAVDLKEWKSTYMTYVKGIRESEKFN